MAKDSENFSEKMDAFLKQSQEKPKMPLGTAIGMLFLGLLALVLVLGIIFGIACYFAFIGMMLWNWFLVPLGIPGITFWHAWGITLVVSIFTGFWTNILNSNSIEAIMKATVDPAQAKKIASKNALIVILTPSMMLFVGWLLHFGI